MSAAEVIALLETLPLSDQQQVREYLERKNNPLQGDAVRQMDLAKAEATGEGVFDRHPELFRRLAQ